MSARLQLLGSPAVEWRGETIALPFERRAQLLAFLALKRGWVGRAEIAAMFWPGQEPKLAYTNLRKTLHRLQSWPWAGVEVQGGALRFEAESDVAIFEASLRDKRLAEALRLHRGDLLAGFDDDASEGWTSWLGFERERLRGAWRAAALDLLEGDIDEEEGIAVSRRLLDADPLDEAALQAHMKWLGAAGQASQARAAYREFVARLQADLGLAPGTQLQALHDSLVVPAAPARPAAPPDDGFVGRSMELRQLSALLAQPACRLVSLLGAGGVGKTRLARRALAELALNYPGGTAFVALEDARTPADLVGAIARETGVMLSRGRDPLEQVIEALRDRRALVALDNFEHLAAEAPLVDRLVKECASIDLVVTTRVRLGVAGEQLLPLEGLPCPDAEDEDRFEAFDAVRLFVKAARRVDPGFMADAEAAAIVDICRQVEGLPLALELAAAWTRVLSCEAIAEHLREGTQLLQAQGASSSSRHASMEVVFDQSWRLLTPAERDVLARVSAFNGGFTVEAARKVANASLPVLGALVDKSLLRKQGARLTMHPLVQHMAGVRLAASPAPDETHRAHALYFERFMTQLRRGIEDGNREALDAMDAECQNCRAAWSWAWQHGMHETVERSMPAMLHFCDHRLRLAEGLALLREAADSREVQAAPGLQPMLLASAAHLEYRLDRYRDAEIDAMRALSATAATRDRATRLQCFKVLGSCGLWLGKLEDARSWYKQALRESGPAVDPNNAAGMMDNLALVEKSMGHYREALKLSQRSLLLHRSLKDVAGEALCLNNQGTLLMTMADYASSGAALREGLALCERHGLTATRALVLTNLTEVALFEGDLDAAESYVTRALAQVEPGQRNVKAYLKLKASEISLLRGRLDGARLELADAMELALEIGRPANKFEGLVHLSRILAAQGEGECAAHVLAFVAAHPAVGAPERDRAKSFLASLPSPRAGAPALDLDDLVQRIVVERNVAYAALIASLKGVEAVA